MKNQIKTTLSEEKTMKLNGVILLQGEPTFKGQIKAREKALLNCLAEQRNVDSEVYPEMLKGWIESHKAEIIAIKRIVESVK